ncbi:MAG: DUF389 domain-containing protein [Saprospiraceae bacterium]
MNTNVYKFLDLHQGEEDKTRVYENIKSNISFRGSNLWILICAILIASIGLNVNSAAVVIGAMLISPLMGPIVGAGFALGTYDFELLRKSGKNLMIATVSSLIVASLYFYLSPFKETQSELLARTSPTIYDVLIAFFGGLAGIVALTRVEKGNPIPGVAIATALMPPLCTAGYGLAIGNYKYFLGAFYLYTINCFFICIATFLIIKYLKYPHVKFPNPQLEKRIRYGITTLIFVLIIPASYLAYDLLIEKTFLQNVDKYITEVFTKQGDGVIYKNVKFHSSPKIIELSLYKDDSFTMKEIDSLNNLLAYYHLDNTKLLINNDIKTETVDQSKIIDPTIEMKLEIAKLKSEILALKDPYSGVKEEIKVLFPEISDVSFGIQNVDDNESTTQYNTMMIVCPKPLKKNKSEQLETWIRHRISKDTVIIVHKTP